MAGAVLLFVTRIGAGRLWPAVTGVEWALTGLIACGFAITWWARVTLGRLWSGDVVRKADHRVVDRGPYRLVRHPIYTGLTLSVIATAGLRASPIAIAGAALVTYGLYLKGRLEERFLRQELGEPYAEYARRTPMLVPFAKSSATSSAG